MIISILALITALLISCVSAFFSVSGLVAIFAAAKLQIIILGSALEFGKVITTLLLHRNWKTLDWKLKSYLLPAVFVLMSITSLGIYGGLAKASIDQQLPTDNIATQVAVIDTQISATQSDLASAQQNLAQLDSVVNQLMSRSSDTKGAQHASNVRNSQKSERAQLNAEITKDQNALIALQQQKAPLTVQQNNLTVQVGPVKYIAALFYGSNPTPDQLANAVRAVILVMVVVFDPLALILLLAASSSLETKRENMTSKFKFSIKIPNWFGRDKNTKEDIKIGTEPSGLPEFAHESIEPENKPAIKHEEDEMDNVNSIKILLDNALIALRAKNEEIEHWKQVQQEYESKLAEQRFIIEGHENTIALLEDQAIEWDQKHIAALNERDQLQYMWNANKAQIAADAENYQTIMKMNEVTISDLRNEIGALNAKLIATQRTLMDFENSNQIMRAEINELNSSEKLATRMLNEETGVEDNEPLVQPKSLIFGTQFPDKPNKSDFFVITSEFPNGLYQWMGTNWTKLDKNMFPEYTKDVDYINYLINQISTGSCDFDQLTKYEQDAVMQALSTIN